MTTQTLAALRQLKLGGMAHALQQQLEQVGTYEGLSFIERLTLLIEQETLNLEQHKQERLIRQARFKLAACVQDIDYAPRRNLVPAIIARLAQRDWIQKGQNLLTRGLVVVARPTWPAHWGIMSACMATACAITASPGCYWN